MIAGHTNQHSLGIIANVAREAALLCEAPDSGAETYPLDPPADTDFGLLHPLLQSLQLSF
jgi:hypothetical protein